MSYSYNYSYDGLDMLFDGVFGTFIGLIAIACWVVSIVALWKIFAKAGKPGWGSLIPFYNTYLMYKITWGNGWLFLLLLIPLVNFVISIITCVKLSKSFGMGGGFAVGLVFLRPIFLIILGLGNYAYIGPDGIPQQGQQAQQDSYVYERTDN